MMRKFFLPILVSTVCMSMQAAEVNQKKAQETAKAYNLSGQRVSETYKGIVIKNGIKVVK